MTQPNHVTAQAEIPKPIEQVPDALVTNIYPIPGTPDVLDVHSQGVMAKYLEQRFINPEPATETRLIWHQTGRTLPAIARVPAGVVNTYNYERDGWLVRPWVSAAVVLGSLAVSLAPTAALDAVDEAKGQYHAVSRYLFPLPDVAVPTTRQVRETGPVRHITVNAGAPNTPGSAVANKRATSRFGNQIANVIKTQDGKVVSIKITGRSSDDYGTNASIGRREPPSQDFADDRARAYKTALRHDHDIPKSIPIHTSVDQSVLSARQKRRVERAAVAAGFTGDNNIIDLMKAVESGADVPKSTQRLINRYFTSKRGVTLDATVTLPGKETTRTVHGTEMVPAEDNPPADPDRDYHPWFIPLPPIPRIRRVFAGVAQKMKFAILPGKPIMQPEILHKDLDQAWVRLRPEAVKEDGTLVDSPWAFTRKYEYLLRDDRITEVMSADYEIGEGEAKEAKSLRVMFVDHEPAEETVEAFTKLLQVFPAMQDGKIAKRVSGIFVYPSEQAGTTHGDPKYVALGGDKQKHQSVLGTYTAALDLVEMHMPTKIDQAGLLELFKSFEGPASVLAHEVGGHATDDTDKKLRLRKIWAHRIPNAHLIVGDPQANRIGRLHGELQDLPDPGRDNSNVRFDITYPVVDNAGKTVTMQARVNAGDPRLEHASTATIVGYKPTDYAAETPAEHYADTAAATITGIPIPFVEAGTDVQTLTADDGAAASFATGYRPDVRAQALYQKAVGAETGTFPLNFTNPPAVTITRVSPADDPLTRKHLIRTRSERTLEEKEMVAILARSTRFVQGKR